MGHKKSIGLPGGPNEFLQDITQYISVDGYKNDSPDKTNPVNIIESGSITMEDVDFPVMGTDNLGNSEMMMPGNNYQFPGDSVLEVPMVQTGYEVPKRQGVRLNYDEEGKVIGESSHIMKTETFDNVNWFSFPTLFQNEDGTWVDMSEQAKKDWKPVYEEAKRRGEIIDFGKDRETALKFGKGSWKPKFQLRGEVDNTKGVIPNQKNVDNSFQRKWLESPMYKKILANEVGPTDDAEFITNSRIGNLQNVPIIVNPGTHEDEDVGATSWSVNGEMEFFKPSHTNHEGHIYENTFEHEVGHSGDRVGEDTLKRYEDNLSIGDKIALANASLSTRPSNIFLPNYVSLANKAYNYITGQETNDLEDRAKQIYKNLNTERLIPTKTIKRFEDERVNIEGYDDDGNPIINKLDIASYGAYDADGNPIVAFNKDGSVKEGQIEIERSPWGDYVSNPTEARTRLNTIRSAAKDLGIYDPMTEPLTREKFQQLIDRSSELNRGESDGFNPLMQLQDVYSDDEIFNQLNEISSVDDSKDKSRYAQKGGAIPKAQTGNRGNNTLDKAVIPVLEGAAEKADEFSTWLGKQTKDLMSPDLDIETRLKMFEQVRPVSYPGFGSIVNEGFGLIGDALGLTDPESPSLDKDGDLDFSEEAWARALKIPTKDKYIKQQTEYKPTTAKDSDVQYYKISDEIFDKEGFLLDFQDMAIGDKQTVDGLLPYMKEAYFEATGQSGSMFMDTDPLQNFQVQVGYDKERDQKYLSMYDKYDFNSIANAGIKPYEFYDRIYIPKDSDKKEKTKNKVDSNILYKQAFVESNLDPKAKSNKGYMGLGQIGDSLIKDYKKANKVDEIDPYDPEQNYQVQEWSMNELYNSSFINKENQDDDVRLIKTLAAYNCGRGNTLDLLNELKEEGEDIYNDVKWVSKLPQETQDYIDMILYDKNTEGRPNVQENFLKTTTDEAYDYYKQLYNYKDINEQDSLPVKQYAGPIRQEEEQSFYLPEMWQQDNYVQEPAPPYMGPFRPAEEKPKQEDDNLTSYTVKSGDNLTRIAEQFGTSVDEIVKLNNIDNPSQININQELKLPESKTKFLNYDIKSGDTLGRIASRFGVPLRKLVEANSSIKNINEIFAGQDIVIPQSNYEEVEEIEETWQDVDLLDEDRKNINDSADEDIIKKAQMVNDPNGHYVIVNKKTKRLEVWRGGKSILDFEVLTGANKGDALTVTKMWDFNQDGKITDEDKRNGKWIPNWSAGNKNTGAGKYYIKESYPDSPDKYGGKGVPSFNLFTDGTDIDVATAIHGPTSGRKGLFNDGNAENNRASNGCINGQCTDLQALYDLGMPAGTAVYVLPEDDGNNFQWVDGQAVLKMSEDNREKYTSNYIDSTGKEQTQQGSNYSVNTLNYQPIRPVFDQQAFEEEVYNETGTLKSIGDIFTSDSSDKEEQENSTKPFIDSLVDNKKKIMVEAGIPSDVYNDIARIAFGIYGNESNFGDTHSAGGNFTRGVTKFVADQNRKGELPIVGSTDLLPKVTSSPDVFKKYDGYSIDTLQGLTSLSPLIALAVKDSQKNNLPVYEKSAKEDYNSVGLTQLRWDNIIKEDKNLPKDKKQINILKKFGITSNKDLLDPEKAAIATVLRLAFLANNRKGVDRNDLFNTLPKHWGGSSKDDGKTYTDNVKKHAKYLKFQQKGKYMPNYAVGGEKKQIQMYKDYIDGVYEGTDKESKAKSLYDKLNRKHYKDAKELGNMSPPNYILTHLYQA
jgi:LysM repeat protein/soluble lytic murein transglycosylase-like protein